MSSQNHLAFLQRIDGYTGKTIKTAKPDKRDLRFSLLLILSVSNPHSS